MVGQEVDEHMMGAVCVGPVAELAVSLEDDAVLLMCPVVLANVGVQVVQPPVIPIVSPE